MILIRNRVVLNVKFGSNIAVKLVFIHTKYRSSCLLCLRVVIFVVYRVHSILLLFRLLRVVILVENVVNKSIPIFINATYKVFYSFQLAELMELIRLKQTYVLIVRFYPSFTKLFHQFQNIILLYLSYIMMLSYFKLL